MRYELFSHKSWSYLTFRFIRRGSSIASHHVQEVSIVISNFLCLRMIWSQSLFSNGEGKLVERFGLLVLPLLSVESCQPMKWMSREGMLGSQVLLVNR